VIYQRFVPFGGNVQFQVVFDGSRCKKMKAALLVWYGIGFGLGDIPGNASALKLHKGNPCLLRKVNFYVF
jgi:hypothetical protein